MIKSQKKKWVSLCLTLVFLIGILQMGSLTAYAMGNLASGLTVAAGTVKASSTSTSSYLADYAVDSAGSSTWWRSHSTDAAPWIRFDLGDIKSINSFNIRAYNTNLSTISSYVIEVSNDPNAYSATDAGTGLWTTLYNGTTIPTGSSLAIACSSFVSPYTNNYTNQRYVQIRITGITQGLSPSIAISDFKVMGSSLLFSNYGQYDVTQPTTWPNYGWIDNCVETPSDPGNNIYQSSYGYAGGNSLRFTVRSEEDQRHAQVDSPVIAYNAAQYTTTDRFMGFAVKFSTDPNDGGTNGITFMQLFDRDEGPVLRLQTIDNNGTFEIVVNDNNPNNTTTYNCPVKLNVSGGWNTVVLKTKITSGSSGYYQIWVNKTPAAYNSDPTPTYSISNRATCHSTNDEINFYAASYASGVGGDVWTNHTVGQERIDWLDSIRIGDASYVSYQDVCPRTVD
jgi:hypothetical protein